MSALSRLLLHAGAVLGAAVLLVTEARAGAGAVDPTFSTSLGLAANTKAAVPLMDGRILLVGDFPRGIVRLNADGTLDTSFGTALNSGGKIARAVLQADGKVLIVGKFATVGGLARGGVARLEPDGAVDPTFAPTANYQDASEAVAVQADGRVVLGGEKIYRLNPDGSPDIAFNALAGPAGGSIAQLLSLPDGRLAVAGAFTTFHGTARPHLVRLEAAGAIDTTFAAVSASGGGVRALLAVAGGKLLVGGAFTNIQSSARTGLVRLNANGTVDDTFAATLGATGTPSVATLAGTPGGLLLVGGIFNTANGTARPNLCRLTASGSTDTLFDPEPSNSLNSGVLQVQLAQGLVLALGQGNNLVRLNTDGSLDRTFAPDPASGPNARVRALALLPDGRAFVGGEFTAFSGRSASFVVRLLPDGSVDATFVSRAPAVVSSLAIQPDGSVVVGCLVSEASGQSAVVRLLSDGTRDAGFDAKITPTDLPAEVRRVAVRNDGRIVVTGKAGAIASRVALRRLNPDGSTDSSLNLSRTGTFEGAALATMVDGRLLVGGQASSGYFPNDATYARLNGLGAVEGAPDAFDFSPAVAGLPIRDLVLQRDGRILLAASAIATARRGIQRLLPGGAVDPTFNPALLATATESVFACAQQQDGRVLIGGDFAGYGSSGGRSKIARLNNNGTVDPAFLPETFSGGSGTTSVLALAPLPDGRVLVGGDFTTIGSGMSPAVRNYIARLNPDGSLDTSFVPGVGVPSINGLALQAADGFVIIGGNFLSAGSQPAAALARLFPDGTLDPSFNAGLTPGDVVNTLVRAPSTGVVYSAGVFANPPPPPLPRPGRLVGGKRPDAGTRPTNPIIRNRVNGSLDLSFRALADDTVYGLNLHTQDRVLVAGQFEFLNSTLQRYLGRLLDTGAIDPSFVAPFDGPVRSVAVLADGRILAGGDFLTVHSQSRPRVVRLLENGGLDPTFSTGTGANGTVYVVRALGNGGSLVAGSFSSYRGVACPGITRLLPDGMVDTTFVPDPITSVVARLPSSRSISSRMGASSSAATSIRWRASHTAISPA